MEEVNITLKLVSQFVTIFLWFLLIVYLIHRHEYIKKWQFVLFVLTFFGMGLAKIQELIVFDMNLDKNIGMYHIVNYMMIYIFYDYINLIVKIKEK